MRDEHLYPTYLFWRIRMVAKPLLVLGLACGLGGCLDTGTLPNVKSVPAPSAATHDETSIDDPSEWPVKILSADARIDLPNYPGGLVEAWMSFNGHHATISGTATSVDLSGNAAPFTFGPVDIDRDNFWGNTASSDFTFVTARSCGTSVQANMVFRVVLRGIGFSGQTTWDSDSKSATVTGRQAACPTRDEEQEETSNPGGGGLGDCVDCINEPVETCMYRITYELQTGEILYIDKLYCF
jgi:hypothetical protein